MKKHKCNIVMVNVNAPKKVILPKGKTFYAKYKRVRINLLPNNIKLRQRYRRRKNNNDKNS